MTQAPLPPLPKTGTLYLLVLFVMLLGYYVLLLASLGGIVYLLFLIALWIPDVLRYVHNIAALKMLAIPVIAIAFFGWSILKSMFVRVGGVESGIPGEVLRHRKLFDVVDEVARTVGAKPIHSLFITPDFNAGVREEAALYLPPGMGKRHMVVGMALLNSMTLDEFKSVLAHEFGHFTNKDTFFSRFIYQVHKSYGILLMELGRDNWHYVNPIYWVLFVYANLYQLVAAAFSRHKEFHADRVAVEGYGRDAFARAQVTSALEGSFFGLGMDYVFQQAARGHVFSNIYYQIGLLRRKYSLESEHELRKILSGALSDTGSAFDTHPSSRDRLKAQNVPTATLVIPPLTGLTTSHRLLEQTPPELIPFTQHGAPSAAEELFGTDVISMQQQLSDMMTVSMRNYIAHLHSQS